MNGVSWGEGGEGMCGSEGLCRLAWLEQRRAEGMGWGSLGKDRGVGTFQHQSEKYGHTSYHCTWQILLF